MAKNIVLSGEYEGKNLMSIRGKKGIQHLSIVLGFTKRIDLTKDNVKGYEVITEDSRKSAVSTVARGAVGGALLGPVGLLAGLSAKNKTDHIVAIEFDDGKQSLLELDEKFYKILIQSTF